MKRTGRPIGKCPSMNVPLPASRVKFSWSRAEAAAGISSPLGPAESRQSKVGSRQMSDVGLATHDKL